MPQSKPMKLQWITINDKNIPFVLPQIWDESKQDWIVTSTNNPLPTQISGRRVEEQSLGISSGIYNESISSNTITVPRGVKGAIFFLRANNVTGTFGENEGVRIRCDIGATGNYIARMETRWSTASTFSGGLLFYPGASLENISAPFASSAFQVASINFEWVRYCRFYVDITGTFAEGEGINVAENFVRWMY